MPDSVRMLVVEDDYMIARDIKRDLEDAGYVVLAPVPLVEAAMCRRGGDLSRQRLSWSTSHGTSSRFRLIMVRINNRSNKRTSASNWRSRRVQRKAASRAREGSRDHLELGRKADNVLQLADHTLKRQN